MARYKKRADGRYATSVTYLGKRYYFTSKTNAELVKKVEEFKASMRAGTYSSNMLLKDWAHQWLMNLQSTIEPNTFNSYETNVRVHIIPALGNFPLCNLQAPHIRDFLSRLLTTHASRTVEHIYANLRAMLKQAVDDDLLAKSPMRSVKKPKATRTRPWVALTEQQVQQLIAAISNPTHQLIVKLAATSGLRRSELLGLRFQDVDLKGRSVSVNQTNKKIGSTPSICEKTKTATSHRTVSIPAALVPLIKEQIKEVKLRSFQDPLWQHNDLLFPGLHGAPLSPDHVTALIRSYGKKAHMPEGFCLNSLRHTSASLLLKHGASYKVVQERLGHSTPLLTLGTYSHVLPGQDAAAAELLSSII